MRDAPARVAIVTLLVGLTACNRTGPVPMSRRMPASARPPAAEATASRLLITLDTDPNAEGRVLGGVDLEGTLASITELALLPSHPVRLEDVTARDVDGAIAIEEAALPRPGDPASSAGGTRVTLRRRARGSLHLSYVVRFTEQDRPDVERSPTLSLRATAPFAAPIELQTGGEDVLLLPLPPGVDRATNPDAELDASLPIEVRIRTGGIKTTVATSFGLGDVELRKGRLADLRNAFFLAGDVGHASFHAGDGDDLAGWLGHTAFDPRWVAAEVAGARSAIDAWVGRSHASDAPPLTFIFGATRRDDAPFVVLPRTRGYFVSVDRRAAWTADARILVAQALTQRYVGGFLWVGDRKDEPAGWFFSEGFSRAIAREVLFERGILEHGERAAEVNALLSAVAFADDDLRRDPTRRRTIAAQGALLATALDVALSKAPVPPDEVRRSLQRFLRERFEEAARAKVDAISRAELLAKVRASAGDTIVTTIEATLTRNAEVPLPPDLLGPCYRLARTNLVAFDLGFTTNSEAELRVVSVKPGSRAEAAGLRVGDLVTKLTYAYGRTQVPVRITVSRSGQAVPLQFLPAGTTRPGRVFERIAGIPDDRCT